MKKNKFLTRFLTAILAGGILVGTVVLSPFITVSAMSVPTQGYSDIRYDDEYEDYIDIVFSYDDYIVGSGTSLKTVTFPIHIGVSLEGDYGLRLTDYDNSPYSYWRDPYGDYQDASFYDGEIDLIPDYPIFDHTTYSYIGLLDDGGTDLPDGIVTPIFTMPYMLSGFVSSCYFPSDENFTTLDIWEIANYINSYNMTIDEGFTFVGTFYNNLDETWEEFYAGSQYTYYRFYALHFSGLYGYLTYFVPYGNTLFDNSVLTITDIPIEPVRSYSDGYNAGITAGYNNGYSAGQTAGYNNGYSAGQTAGYNAGYSSGDSDGYSRGYDEGYDIGYDEGLENGGGGTIVVDELDYTRTIAENVNNLLGIAIFPGITFRTILLMSFGLVLAFAIFKFIF